MSKASKWLSQNGYKMGDIVETAWDDVPNITGIIVQVPDEARPGRNKNAGKWFASYRAMFPGDTYDQGVEHEQIVAKHGNALEGLS